MNETVASLRPQGAVAVTSGPWDRPDRQVSCPSLCFPVGARTSYQPVSPSRLPKDINQKNFSNLYGTKGRAMLGRGAGEGASSRCKGRVCLCVR